MLLLLTCVSCGVFYILDNKSIIQEETPLDDDVTQNAPTNTDYWTDSGNYASSFAGGSGTEDDPYQIATSAQLARLAYFVNTYSVGTSSRNQMYRYFYYIQTANINLSAHYWARIGTEENYFAGHYDGNGFTISEIFTERQNSGTYSEIGLFGYVNGTSSSDRAELHDITLGNATIQGYDNLGGIAGYITNTNIYDCKTSPTATITLYATGVSGYNAGGGIIGDAGINCDITYSSNEADIEATGISCLGGVVGSLSSSLSGIINVNNCWNKGDIYTASRYGAYPNNRGAGGVIGYAWGSSLNIAMCFNTGNIQIGSNSSIPVGGVVGNYLVASSGIHIFGDCYNIGNVTLDGNGSYCGGIIGYLYGEVSGSGLRVTNCYNAGAVLNSSSSGGGIIGYVSSFGATARVYNCFNVGETAPYAIIGLDLASSTITNCYWGGDCTVTSASLSSTTVVNSSRLTASEDTTFKNLSWYTTSSNWESSYPWDFESTWMIVEGQNNGYPILLDTDLDVYIIEYDANGGSGTMDPSTKIYGVAITLRTNTFTRTGYTFQGWATSANGDVAYSNGATYTANANVTLYAVWKAITYTITYNGNGATGGSMASSTKTYGVALTLRTNTYTRTGFYFAGWSTSQTGGVAYSDGANFTTNANTTLYAVWRASNPAYYDSEGDYWYIENGYMPQSRVTNTTTWNYLNSNWSSLSNIRTYYMDAITSLSSKEYGGKEYCKYNDEYYLVEPIRWRLDYNSNQTPGFGTKTSTLAIMAKIVYVGRYSLSEINAGGGYQAFSVSSNMMFNRITNTYLANWRPLVQLR